MTETLLPHNATRLERALEQALATRLDALPVPIKDTLNADVIPVASLPWLGYSFGLRTWNADWPEMVRRSVVKNAIPTARRKGSVQSVRDVVAAFGGSLAIREWWELTPKGSPFTFSIVLTLNGQSGEPVTARFVEEVVAEIERAKPARAHFTFTQGLSFAGGFAVQGGVRPTTIRRLEFEQAA
ncbi:phage tail protein I [Brevundimonas vesicularis]|uniref:Phage tail protein I n=1 Tax=Brevundimonas vesicularis TaxID=41276 RepID=A0A1Z3UCW5_BREVE|nr:phage tail protein I [Brevundimonas vesicularis]ASE41136.1 phage tail protein I [Brevundimonas vesicularis]